MENYSYSSYNSGDSTSPRSREIDWDDTHQNPQNYKVKFMVSYNGKIHPRPHDTNNNHLAYVGGDTKIITVDRNVRFMPLLSKLSTLVNGNVNDVCFKYQLPGEDLDALITVSNDEDLEHMMLEYDRVCRGGGGGNGSGRVPRLRLFLFRVRGAGTGIASGGNPDYLFGLDKVGVKEGGSDCGSEAVASPTEIQRQINELQRLQVSGQLVRKVGEEGGGGGFGGEEFYGQDLTEKVVVPPAPAPVAVPMPVGVHPGYVQERHGNFQVAVGPGTVVSGGGDQQPVYLIPAGAPHGLYQGGPPPTGMRPVAGHPGQGYYGMQRVVQDVYHEQPVYGQPGSIQQQQQGSIQQQQGLIQQQGQGQKVSAGYGEGMGMGMMQQKVEQGYVQIGYDAAGRQVYYTTPAGVAPPVYQMTSSPMAAAVEGKIVGSGGVNQDGKV